MDILVYTLHTEQIEGWYWLLFSLEHQWSIFLNQCPPSWSLCSAVQCSAVQGNACYPLTIHDVKSRLILSSLFHSFSLDFNKSSQWSRNFQFPLCLSLCLLRQHIECQWRMSRLKLLKFWEKITYHLVKLFDLSKQWKCRIVFLIFKICSISWKPFLS